ncbi:FtsX-like permease family protein [Spirochaeta lutea]|uniref:ABC3 transporter permease C-terminal domain-containing protein n=1 Tax=Spirochaeta lutea TaxID=1480694 RepID=A0A098QUG7_9SPIO|nr:ABC transporter permease [Spirochaeta lutea]KGE71226.1 hypothetical protein DC28_12275 [Spirochaeta lutea]
MPRNASIAALTWASFRRRIGQYSTYAFSAAIAIMVYYIFAIVFSSPEVTSQIDENLRLEGLFRGSAVIVAVFSAVFLWYGTIIFTGQRKREFALYRLHGMSRPVLFGIILGEQVAVGLLASAIGLGGGVLLSRFFLVIFQSLTGIPGVITIGHSLTGFFEVTAVFLPFFLIAGILSFITALLTPVRTLFHSQRSMQGRPRPPKFLSVLGVGLVTIGYVLSTRVTMDTILQLFLPVVGITIVGTFLVFQGIHVALASWYRRRGNTLGDPVLISAGGNLMFRRKNYGLVLATVAVMNAIAITGIGVLLVFYSDATSVREQMTRLSQVDIAFEISGDSDVPGPQEIPETAMQPNLSTQILEFSSPASQFPDSPESAAWIVSRSQIENLLSVQGGTLPPIPRGTLLFYTRPPSDQPASPGTLPPEVLGRVQRFIETLAWQDALPLDPSMVITKQLLPQWILGSTLAVMSDADYQVLTENGFFRTNKYVATIQAVPAGAAAVQTGEDPEGIKALRKVDRVMEQRFSQEWIDGEYFSLSLGMDEFYRYVGLYFFIILFMALVVFAGNAGLVFFRSITDAYTARHRFILMQKIGVSVSQIRAIVRAEIIPGFYLPLLVGGVHTAFALRVLESVLGLSVWGAFIGLSLGYVVLFGICALAASRVYQTIVLPQEKIPGA